MNHRALIGLGLLGFASLASIGCSNAAPTLRNVTGTVPAADLITSVEAVQVGNPANAHTAVVDANGHFSITLPIGQRFYIVFKANDQIVGALRYMSSAGAFKSAVAVTHAPNAEPSMKSASVDGDDGDAEDNDDGEVEEDDIDLGDVDNDAGDDKYEPSRSPESESDSDGDGENDFDDQDEGNVDDGDDNNEDVDSDDDGLPDVVDTDDDGDGIADSDDTV